LIAAKYRCDLDTMLPQRRNQPLDCHSPWLGGSIISFPVPKAVDVEIGGIGAGEARLRPPASTRIRSVVVPRELGRAAQAKRATIGSRRRHRRRHSRHAMAETDLDL
jgi:hypothetical protein